MSIKSEFEHKLRSTFIVVERTGLKLNNRGLRILQLGGDFIESVSDEFLKLLKDALPKDVVLLTVDDVIMQMQLGYLSTVVHDRYALIFCSQEWSRVEPGGKIPRIEALFHKSNSTVVPYYCEIKDVIEETNSLKDLKDLRVDYKDILKVLLDTILDPHNKTSNVIGVAKSLKQIHFKEDN